MICLSLVTSQSQNLSPYSAEVGGWTTIVSVRTEKVGMIVSFFVLRRQKTHFLGCILVCNSVFSITLEIGACRWVLLYLSSSKFKVQKNKLFPLLLTTGFTKSKQRFAFLLTPPTYLLFKRKKSTQWLWVCFWVQNGGKSGISRKCRVIDLAGNKGGMPGDSIHIAAGCDP